MKFYGGNTKRIIKKHAFFDFDGCQYAFEQGLFVLDCVSKLKVGDMIWNPFTGNWRPLIKIEFVCHNLHDYYSSRSIRGWWVSEFVLTVEDVVKYDDSMHEYYIRDIEHWHAGWSNYSIDRKMANAFNKQIGLPEDFVPFQFEEILYPTKFF